ncbi:MAG: S28 family serine protease [Polyangiaceae bacterium]
MLSRQRSFGATMAVLALAVLSGCDEETDFHPPIGTDQPTELSEKLAAIPGMRILEHAVGLKSEQFVLGFLQPADHDDPDGEQFEQRISLLHRGEEAPMILGTTGYELRGYEMEPTALLGANQLMVEQRFFSPSRPDPADWRTLRIRQAAADHHRIALALKPLYPAKWLSSGASKGGMTSVYHRRFYPDDVEGTVAYVAPQSYGDADPRYVDFLENVGPAECRGALRAFQKEVLSRREAMTAKMFELGGADAFSQLGADAALDYAVIELPFGFWQYFGESLCAKIPDATATDAAVWAFLDKVVSPSWWSDSSFFNYEPYYFQAAVELGYPGIDDSHLVGLLTVPPGADVAASQVVPGPTKEMVLDAEAMPDIADWLSSEGERMLFVYGERDPYSSAAFELGGAKDSYLFVVPEGNHGASIGDLPGPIQDTAVGVLSGWAGVLPMPVPPETLEEERRVRLSLGRGRRVAAGHK